MPVTSKERLGLETLFDMGQQMVAAYAGHFIFGIPLLVAGIVFIGFARDQADPDRSQYMRRFGLVLLVPGIGLVGYALTMIFVAPLVMVVVFYMLGLGG